MLAAACCGSAPAATMLGQIGNAQPCLEDRAHAQQATPGGNLYRAEAYGVITSWTTAQAIEAGHTLQLVIMRSRIGPGGVGHFYTALKKDVVRPLSAAIINSFGVRIPIEAGEELALYVPPGQPLVMGVPAGRCLHVTGFLEDQYRTHPGDPPFGTELDYTSSGTQYRLNVLAKVEPDVDRDGFGDETQDRCPENGGTQSFCTCATRKPTVMGDDKDNVLRGTPRADTIVGLGGNDRIRGRGGRDYICGGEGNDRISGGRGGDLLVGENGRDVLRGGPHSDALYGGKGKDKLRGGPGKDGQTQ